MARVALLSDDPENPTSVTLLRGLRGALGPEPCRLFSERRPRPGLWTAGEARLFSPCGRDWRRLPELCAKEGVRAVHLHAHGYRAADMIGSARRSATGARLVTTLHFTPSRELDRAAYRRLLDVSDRVAVPSESMRSELAKAFPGRPVAVVANGVDSDFFRPGPAVRTRRPYLLSLAKLAYYKGTDVLLMAFRDLLDRGHDLDLVLCGSVRPPCDWRALAASLGIEDRVRALTPRPRAEVRRLLRGCLFLVLASRWEAHSLALLEALACGKTAAATAVGSHREFLGRARCGLAVSPQDPAALAGAMDRLARDAGLRRRLESNARAVARSYSWARAARAYRKLYSA